MRRIHNASFDVRVGTSWVDATRAVLNEDRYDLRITTEHMSSTPIQEEEKEYVLLSVYGDRMIVVNTIHKGSSSTLDDTVTNTSDRQGCTDTIVGWCINDTKETLIRNADNLTNAIQKGVKEL